MPNFYWHYNFVSIISKVSRLDNLLTLSCMAYWRKLSVHTYLVKDLFVWSVCAGCHNDDSWVAKVSDLMCPIFLKFLFHDQWFNLKIINSGLSWKRNHRETHFYAFSEILLSSLYVRWEERLEINFQTFLWISWRPIFGWSEYHFIYRNINMLWGYLERFNGFYLPDLGCWIPSQLQPSLDQFWKLCYQGIYHSKKKPCQCLSFLLLFLKYSFIMLNGLGYCHIYN